MKFYNVSSLFEAIADKQLDKASDTFDQNLKIVRLIDYLSAGMNSTFTDEYTQVGGSELKKKDEHGARSAHKDYCMSCVNSILTQENFQKFNGLKWKDVLVPRIPLDFEGSEDDADSEWQFLESCPEVKNNFSGQSVITLNKENAGRSSILGMDNAKKISDQAVFYKSSLLVGYINDTQELAYVDNGEVGIISLNPKGNLLNLDPDMKYLDAEIDGQRKNALEFLKKILNYDENSITVTNENSGEAKNDVKDLLASFKSKGIPEDGYIFMSPNEIKEFLPLFEYVRVGGAKNDSFFEILTNGMTSLEDAGVHFGDNLKVAEDVQNTIMQGDYDLVVGYSQEGDTTHSKTFNNQGEQIFVGYLTNYPGQEGDNVIPVYFSTKDPNRIASLNASIDNKEPLHVKSLKLRNTMIPFKKLNTSGVAKRTGGNEIIFQLPAEIFTQAGKPEAQSAEKVNAPSTTADQTPAPTAETPKAEAIPQPEKTKAPAKSKGEPKPKTPAKPKTPKEPTAEQPKAAEPTPTPTSKESVTSLTNKIGSEFKAGNISREQAINNLQAELNSTLGKNYSKEQVAKHFNKNYPERSENDVRREDEYSALLGPEGRNTRLAKSAIDRVKSLAQLGHKFTPDEVDNLASRGLPKADIEKALGKFAMAEVRLSPKSFSLKAMMENLNSKRLK